MALIRGADITIELLTGTPTPYVDTVLGGLIGYWRLGETSGTAAAAVVGAAGTYTGTPTLGVPGLLYEDPNTAVRLSGAVNAQYIALPASARVTAAHSAFIWFERLGLPNGTGDKTYHALLSTLSGHSAHPRLLLAADGSTVTWMGFDAGLVLRSGPALAIPSPAGRHLYGWTFDGSAAQVYLDGQPLGAPVACVGLATSTGLPRIGTHNTASVYQANGVFDEPRIYNRALTPAEVTELYSIGSEGPGGWTDLTCETTGADWQWGATVPLGPITVTEGGTITVHLWDPERTYDPVNADSPLASILRVGLPLRVRVDGSPAWTGALQSWTWDRVSLISTLEGLDPVGQMAAMVFPDTDGGIVYATTYAQVIAVLDRVGWPAAMRYFPTPTGVVRGSRILGGSVLDYLAEITFAELGQLYARRDGKIAWINRGGVAPPAPSAVINCGGAGLTDMTTADGLSRVRNRVLVGRMIYAGGTIPALEARSVYAGGTELQLETLPPPAPEAVPLWAITVFHALSQPSPLTVLGTILPLGAQVEPVVCAEWGDRWSVVNATETRVVRVVGMKVNLAPGTIEVDAVTEDVSVTPPPATPYWDDVITTVPLGYWRLGESSVTQPAGDERGRNPGTYVGSPTLGVAGALTEPNTAATFAASQWVNVPASADFNIGDSGSFEAWVNLATVTGGLRTIVGKGTDAFAMRINAAGRLELVRSGVSVIVASTTVLTAGVWTHVVAVKGGPLLTKLYINGVDRTGPVTVNASLNTVLPLTIGADTNTDGTHRDQFIGGLDEVAVYQKTLLAEEVLRHYNNR